MSDSVAGTTPDAPSSAEDAVAVRLRELEWIQDRMMHVIGHALWTPVATVAGLASSLQPGVAVDDRVRAALVSASQRLHTAVDDVLVANEVDTRFPIDGAATCDFDGAITTAWHDIDDAARSQSTLEVTFEDAARTVAMSHEGARRMLRHVLHNAARYGSGRVRVEVHGTEGMLRCTVHNDGEVLPPDDAARAFERFYRGERAVMTEAAGLGLGLPIARLLARRVGGDVTLEAHDAGGVTTTMVVPTP